MEGAMQFAKYVFFVILSSLIINFKSIVSCPTSLGKNLLDTNQISYKDLSKQANVYE